MALNGGRGAGKREESIGGNRGKETALSLTLKRVREKRPQPRPQAMFTANLDLASSAAETT